MTSHYCCAGIRRLGRKCPWCCAPSKCRLIPPSIARLPVYLADLLPHLAQRRRRPPSLRDRCIHLGTAFSLDWAKKFLTFMDQDPILHA